MEPEDYEDSRKALSVVDELMKLAEEIMESLSFSIRNTATPQENTNKQRSSKENDKITVLPGDYGVSEFIEPDTALNVNGDKIDIIFLWTTLGLQHVFYPHMLKKCRIPS